MGQRIIKKRDFSISSVVLKELNPTEFFIRGLCLYFVLFSFAKIALYKSGIESTVIYSMMYEVLLGSTMCWYVFKRTKPVFPAHFYWVLLYLGIGIVAFISNFPVSAYAFRWYFYPIATLSLIVLFPPEKPQKSLLFVYATVTAFCVVGLLLYFFHTPFYEFVDGIWVKKSVLYTSGFPRYVSVFQNPLAASPVFLLMSIASLYFFAAKKKWYFGALSIFFLCSILMSFSRSALVGLVFAAILLMVTVKDKLFRLFTLGVFSLFIISAVYVVHNYSMTSNYVSRVVYHYVTILPKSVVNKMMAASRSLSPGTGSELTEEISKYAPKYSPYEERQHAFTNAKEIVMEKPIFGKGLGVFSQPYQFSSKMQIEDCSYCTIAAELGLIGFLSFGAVIIYLITLLRKRKTVLAKFAIAMLLGLSIQAIFSSSWYQFPATTLIMLFCGLAVVIKSDKLESNSQNELA